MSASWPGIKVETRITALHGHHLCGAVLRGDQDALSYPVVVDLRAHTTRVIQADGVGTFTTREIELELLQKYRHPSHEGPEIGTVLATGPAVLDDDHAYVIVARPLTALHAPKEHAVIHLLKIALDDGTITASTTVGESQHMVWLPTIHLNLSDDGASLLVSSSAPGDVIGLRLDKSDLSVQFDVHDLPDAPFIAVGDALETRRRTPPDSLVLLTDGQSLPAPGGTHTFVVGHWHYRQESDSGPVVLRDLTTGEDTALFGFPDRGLGFPAHSLAYPRVWSRQFVLAGKDSEDVHLPMSAWRVGEASPLLRWSVDERADVPGHAVFGDVLYITDSRTEDELVLRSLRSGDILGTTPIRWREGGLAVNSWGIATAERFIPADDWF